MCELQLVRYHYMTTVFFFTSEYDLHNDLLHIFVFAH